MGPVFPGIVETERERLRLRSESVWVDALVIATVAGGALDDSLPNLSVFSGSLLLDGLDNLSDEFDHWLTLERQKLEERIRQWNETNVRSSVLDPQPRLQRVEIARRSVVIDPTNEEAVRELMRALGAAGQRAQAMLEYERCRTILRSRLDIEPAPETQVLYRELRRETASEGEAARSTPASIPALSLRLSEVAKSRAGEVPGGNEARPSIAVLPVREDAAGPRPSSGSDLAGERVKRRLTTILAVVGSDAKGTLAQWKEHWSALIEPKTKEHRGCLVSVAGDGILVEFATILDAMNYTVEVQRGMAERNTHVALDKRMELRMGINFGELTTDAGDVLSDGANLAARLAALAKPGGICISSRVQEEAQGKLDVSFEDAGEQQLKDIAHPVRVYHVRFEGVANPVRALALPEKPSIAVLPFQNLSREPEQEHFADGMVEEITTALSRIRQFFVIARNSSFSYKGSPVDVKQVGRELGVRYVLEGSVRKAANRVRVAAQLIDAITGHHIWAERYDRECVDIFALQDEITEQIVATIEPQLYIAEYSRVKRKSPESLDAWECTMRAFSHINNRSISDYTVAQELLTKAIEIDPTYAQAQALMAYLTALKALYGWVAEEDALASAWNAAQRALLLDADDPWVHLALGFVHQQCRRSEDAVEEYQKALSLNPNFALAHTYLAFALCFLGQHDQALAHIATSERLNPRGLLHGVNNLLRAVAHFLAGQHREAIGFARKSVLESPGIVPGYRHLVVNCALAGEINEAKAALQILRRLQPELSVAWLEKWLPYRCASDRQKFIQGFRLAGLE